MKKPLHFLTLYDLSPSELNALVLRAIELKNRLKSGLEDLPLKGKVLAMIFELNSTRTRVAFETGIQQLGGHAVYLSAQDSQLGRGEPIADTARVLSEMVDLVVIRAKDHQYVCEFSKYSRIPVINGMTNMSHPCQILADIQTYTETRGSIHGKKVAFIGDGYNMCNSYIRAAKQFDFSLNIATPKSHKPNQKLLSAVDQAIWIDNPEEAVASADLVVTDVWSSMGHEEEGNDRLASFDGFQVDSELLDRANKDAIFMHCLPAHRGEEISNNLLDDTRSVVWQEAGNRLHSQKALMELLLK